MPGITFQVSHNEEGSDMKTLFLLFVTLLSFVSLAESQEFVLWSGGISEEERATAPDEGIKLVFFIRSGNFLADIKVSVKDQSGQELVNTVSTGPWLILALPDGNYSVVAERSNGAIQSLVISVDSNGAREFGFVFPDN